MSQNLLILGAGADRTAGIPAFAAHRSAGVSEHAGQDFRSALGRLGRLAHHPAHVAVALRLLARLAERNDRDD